MIYFNFKNTSQIEVKNGESGTERFQFVYFLKKQMKIIHEKCNK